MQKIFFHYADRKLNISRKKETRTFVKNIFINEGVSLQRIDYIFCSDEFLLEINRIHLQHDYFTDILTFDLSESNKIIGEIYISIDRVVENATTFKSSFVSEALRVIFHGALHLCGYNDKNQKDKITMRNMEDKYISLFLN